MTVWINIVVQICFIYSLVFSSPVNVSDFDKNPTEKPAQGTVNAKSSSNVTNIHDNITTTDSQVKSDKHERNEGLGLPNGSSRSLNSGNIQDYSWSDNQVLGVNPTPTRKWATLDGQAPLIFGHRGEKILAPEHTLYGYELAIILGADYVEPDLILTKDNHLVCYHDPYIVEENTDVADHPEFQHLRRRMSDGTTKWAVKDFTLAEIKTLKLKQPNVGIRPQELNGVFQIPTFQEFLELVHTLSFKLNKRLGIIPELKEPASNNERNGPHFMENLLLTILESNGYAVNKNQAENCQAKLTRPTSHSLDYKKIIIGRINCPRVIIQSFELPALEYLKQKSSFDLLMLVLDDPRFLTRQGIQTVARIAKYFSVYKSMLVVEAPQFFKSTNVTYNMQEINQLGGFIPYTEIPYEVHSNGLKLVAFTFYDSREPTLLDCPKPLSNGDCPTVSRWEELNYFFSLGVDGIFVENVAEALEIRKEVYFESFIPKSYQKQIYQVAPIHLNPTIQTSSGDKHTELGGMNNNNNQNQLNQWKQSAPIIESSYHIQSQPERVTSDVSQVSHNSKNAWSNGFTHVGLGNQRQDHVIGGQNRIHSQGQGNSQGYDYDQSKSQSQAGSSGSENLLTNPFKFVPQTLFETMAFPSIPIPKFPNPVQFPFMSHFGR